MSYHETARTRNLCIQSARSVAVKLAPRALMRVVTIDRPGSQKHGHHCRLDCFDVIVNYGASQVYVSSMPYLDASGVPVHPGSKFSPRRRLLLWAALSLLSCTSLHVGCVHKPQGCFSTFIAAFRVCSRYVMFRDMQALLLSCSATPGKCEFMLCT